MKKNRTDKMIFRLKQKTLIFTNASIWFITIIVVATLLLDTQYFYSTFLTLSIASVISIILTVGNTKTDNQEWYEGS